MCGFYSSRLGIQAGLARQLLDSSRQRRRQFQVVLHSRARDGMPEMVDGVAAQLLDTTPAVVEIAPRFARQCGERIVHHRGVPCHETPCRIIRRVSIHQPC